MPLSRAALFDSSKAMRWAVIVWTVLCVGCCVRSYFSPVRNSVYPDYADAGRSWLAGTDAYHLREVGETVTQENSGYRYVPIVSVLLVPFSIFPDNIGNVLWRAFSFACLIGAFAWFEKAVLPARLSALQRAALWLLVLPLSLGSMNNGQANVLLIAFLLAATAAVASERWNITAACLASAVLLKAYPLAVALLMLAVYPRRLGWRLPAALAIGLALPFALQSPSYVFGQYENWYRIISADDRHDFPMNHGYRDFYLLTRYVGVPLRGVAYAVVQLAAAALVATVCIVGKRLRWPSRHLAQTVLALGCSWMIVFGPSTESSTFILLAPSLAWALVDAFRPDRDIWVKATLSTIMATFALTFMAAWFPGGRDWFYILQPLAALAFFVERIMNCVPQTSELADEDNALPLLASGQSRAA